MAMADFVVIGLESEGGKLVLLRFSIFVKKRSRIGGALRL
jgi:hypothetical protein